MPRTNDSLKQFVALRSALEQERSTLQSRLSEIESALGSEAASATPAAPRRGRPPGRPPGRPAGVATAQRRGPGRRPANGLSMRDAITQVVRSQPRKIREIVQGMENAGFVFKSKNPVNSVGAYLYGPEGKKYFKRADGKFLAK